MEATIDSDLDLLIEPGQIETFTQMAKFLEDLEESITKKIDILTIEQLKDSHILKEEIDKDRILLYRK
jgi:predicted nucleotidyltransferase